MKFVSYEEGTGRILFSGEMPEEMISLQQGNILLGDGTPDTHYVDVVNKVLVTKPPKPGDLYSWNYQEKEWYPDPDKARLAALMRRGQLLQQSDWTQLPDVPQPTRQKWAAYRQALRDITEQSGYPLDIQWPKPPN